MSDYRLETLLESSRDTLDAAADAAAEARATRAAVARKPSRVLVLASLALIACVAAALVLTRSEVARDRDLIVTDTIVTEPPSTTTPDSSGTDDDDELLQVGNEAEQGFVVRSEDDALVESMMDLMIVEGPDDLATKLEVSEGEKEALLMVRAIDVRDRSGKLIGKWAYYYVPLADYPALLADAERLLAARGLEEGFEDQATGTLVPIGGLGFRAVPALVPSGLAIADERTLTVGIALVTFTPDGQRAVPGNGPALKLSAHADPNGESNLETHRLQGARQVTVQGHRGVVVADEDSSPQKLGLPPELGLTERWVSVGWIDDAGVSVAVQGKGIPVEQLVAIANGLTYQP